MGVLTGAAAYEVVRSLMTRPVEEYGDKRVKVCVYCRYPWRDPSLRNTRGTCSDDCRRGLKSEQRYKLRAEQALVRARWQVQDKKPKPNYYLYWYEYPFWLNEYEMLKRSWKYEASGYDQNFLDKMSAKNDKVGLGNRVTPKRTPGAEDMRSYRRWKRKK